MVTDDAERREAAERAFYGPQPDWNPFPPRRYVSGTNEEIIARIDAAFREREALAEQRGAIEALEEAVKIVADEHHLEHRDKGCYCSRLRALIEARRK